MQQQNSNLQSSPSNSFGISEDLNQRIIKIEETPAYHRSKHRTVRKVEPKHHHHLSTGNFDLVRVQWQGGFPLEQDPHEDRYIIYLVLAGSLSQKIDSSQRFAPSGCPDPGSKTRHERLRYHQTFDCSIDTATIVSPGQKLENIASEQGEALLIKIDRDSIDLALNKLLIGRATLKEPRTFKQPVIFLTSIDLTSELGLNLKNFGQFLWETAAKNDSLSAETDAPPTGRLLHRANFSSLVLQKLEQAFLDCLIEGLPNNYSDEILYQTDGALACHVRKATAYIESQLHEDIKLGDIATATGVSPRLLQKAFSHHCGCSPMRFVTRARLERIRQELTAATTNTKIVDVMMHYHLTQGGKFAKEYQQLFGEKPSETLKRSSQNVPLWHQIDDVRADRVAGGATYGAIDRQRIEAKNLTSSSLVAGLQQLFLPAWRSPIL
jgi:AraC-like DNA-binding protein